MTIQRISTLAIHQNTLSDVNRVQAGLVDLQKQISSGFKTDRYEGLAGQVEHFSSLESKIRKSTTYIEQNEVVISRLNTQQNAIGNIIELGDQVEDLISLRRNPAAGDSLNFDLQIKSLRETIAETLNISFEGRYLFGGTQTATAPVTSDPVPGPAVPGQADDSYYNGSKESLTVRVQDGYEIEYSVRADESGFQKLFTAIDLALGADSSDSDTLLGQAFELAGEGVQEVIAVQAEVNSNIIAIENINTRHEELNLYWTGVKENIINTDVVEASTRIAIDQTILQASFQSFARLSQLTLADFLR